MNLPLSQLVALAPRHYPTAAGLLKTGYQRTKRIVLLTGPAELFRSRP